MKQNFNCNDCIHKDICKNIEFLDEIQEKVNTRIDNIYMPDNFEIIIRCKNYIDKICINFSTHIKDHSNCSLLKKEL